MAVVAIIPVLLFAAISPCKCEPTHGFRHNSDKSTSHIGDILKPPPLPQASNIVPVPFHGGAGRNQRQNHDIGYHYQPPPPPPPPPHPHSHSHPPASNFKFPAPFYKQYNFNFVPPPQPFTTTPAPSLFQKVSGWLFPSAQTNYDGGAAQLSASKKECNPCNSMPWIPVIRYDLAAKNIHQDIQPTYGAPSPTAVQNSFQYSPHPFHLPQNNLPQLSTGVPHESYGPPTQQQNFQTFRTPSSTYGPPSATHSVDNFSQSPPSSTFGVISSSYNAPSSSYGTPSSSYGVPSSSYVSQSSSYSVPSSSVEVPSSTYGVPSSSFGTPSSTYGAPSPYAISSSSNAKPSSTYGVSSSTYSTPLNGYSNPASTSSNFVTVTHNYAEVVPNYQPPQANDVDFLRITGPDSQQQLPKVSQPTGFRNSYGEPVANSYLDIPYPVSAAEGSNKVKTEILPNGQKVEHQNESFALAKPAPFSLNRGRNIHTLQPVALPNLSVSPLPPIFNARPFRIVSVTKNLAENVHGINNMQKNVNKVNIAQSVPVAEFSESTYPATVIQSPIIDLSIKNFNQSKAYRNIPNSFIVDQNRDISSQASEDHVAATESNYKIPDNSFESTGVDVGNDLYDIPAEMKNYNRVPPNHRENFADLRGVPDQDIDKYRTESNLQSIDSPLLYLKPSAPHKNYDHFLLAVSTPANGNDYEIYDETPTTVLPELTLNTNLREDIKSENGIGLSSQTNIRGTEDKPKVVQIIIPYTTGQQATQNSVNFGQSAHEWTSASDDEFQARKVPPYTENYYNSNTESESYSTEPTTTQEPNLSSNGYYESNKLNTPNILNDLYDVREPPFDIIKLQHNIDDWTEQQFSQYHQQSQNSASQPRPSGKYAHAKQIPDDYFTTISPIANYVTVGNYDFYDHEGSDSIQHSVTNNIINNTCPKPRKEYNIIPRENEKTTMKKNKVNADGQRPHIYTAASSFRVTSTTSAPWGKIETSISPLTKEKVYVVTSKPWRDTINDTNWLEPFESKKTTKLDNDLSASDSFPYKSPRFSNRPSFEQSSRENLKSDYSQEFSQNWHRSINDLEAQSNSANLTTTLPEGSPQHFTTNMDEMTTTAATRNI